MLWVLEGNSHELSPRQHLQLFCIFWLLYSFWPSSGIVAGRLLIDAQSHCLLLVHLGCFELLVRFLWVMYVVKFTFSGKIFKFVDVWSFKILTNNSLYFSDMCCNIPLSSLNLTIWLFSLLVSLRACHYHLSFQSFDSLFHWSFVLSFYTLILYFQPWYLSFLSFLWF